MSGTPESCRVIVLVKALPQPSKRYGETVCCAGITADGAWKRLYPIRFRHLDGASSFGRWDWLTYSYSRPPRDNRAESCHVWEDSIRVDGQVAQAERSRMLEPLIMPSAEAAAAAGRSLTLVRPRNARFIVKTKKQSHIADEREAYRKAASQGSMFDKQLAEIEPSPHEFRFVFEDDAGRHDYQNGDWETHVMYWKWREKYGDQQAVTYMVERFNEEYPRKGMLFALGNMAKRPQTWQLLGVIRHDEPRQGDLFS